VRSTGRAERRLADDVARRACAGSARRRDPGRSSAPRASPRCAALLLIFETCLAAIEHLAVRGRRMPATMRPSVDLPQPDSPTRPTTSPSRTCRSTRSTAWTTSSRMPAPKALAIRPPRRAPCEALRDALELDDRRRAHALTGTSGMDAAREACAPRRNRDPAAPAAQAASARGQRVRKAQPSAASSDGVMPGICCSGSPRSLRLGTEPIRPARVGMRGWSSTSSTRPRSTMRPGVHHADASASRRRPTGRA
jgi:hypothetical protein